MFFVPFNLLEGTLSWEGGVSTVPGQVPAMGRLGQIAHLPREGLVSYPLGLSRRVNELKRVNAENTTCHIVGNTYTFNGNYAVFTTLLVFNSTKH